MVPWHLYTTTTKRVDLTFTPFFERNAKTEVLIIFSEVHQMFSHFNGVLDNGDGNQIQINNGVK